MQLVTVSYIPCSSTCAVFQGSGVFSEARHCSYPTENWHLFPFVFQLSDELLITALEGKGCFWVSQVAADAEPHLQGICRCCPYGARGSPCVTADFRLGTWIASPAFLIPCLPAAPPAESRYGARTSTYHYPWKGVLVGCAGTVTVTPSVPPWVTPGPAVLEFVLTAKLGMGKKCWPGEFSLSRLLDA